MLSRMKVLQAARWFLFVTTVFVSGALVADLHAAMQVIALTGDLQPGGSARLSGVSQATVNNAGHVAFRATLAHGIGGISSANDRAVWKVAGAQRSLVTWGGVSAAPGGGTVDQIISASIDDEGDVVVRGTEAAASGIWRFQSGGASQVIASTGVPSVPGISESTLDSLAAPHLHHPSGLVAYNAILTQGGSVSGENDRGVWIDDGVGSLLMREQVTETPGIPGGQFATPIAHSINANGEVAVSANMNIGPGGVDLQNAVGLWRIGVDGGSLIARKNSGGVPGLPGASYSSFLDPMLRINNAGAVAFQAHLATGGDITAANDRGVWLLEKSGGHLLAQAGMEPPGAPGTVFADFGDPLLNDGNEVLVQGTLVEGMGGATASNAQGIWRLSAEGGDLLARAGSGGVPGAPGASFESFGASAFNASGAAVFGATLTDGVGGVNESNDQGLWLFTKTSAFLVAREGDTLAGRTIDSLGLTAESGGSDGRQRNLNEANQLLFKATFTNGDEGLFLFTPDGGPPNIADFNLDGRVDGLDLTRWKSHVGASSGAAHADGDADGDADVDGADFLAWQREVGFGASVAAVPEPPATALLFPAGLLLGLVLRRDRHAVPELS